MKLTLTLVLVLCFFVQTTAQKQSNNWYFGQSAAIEFSTGSPVALTGSAMYTLHGCSTISDSAGNLLFYTDGKKVYNKFHQQMPNGFGLLGGDGTQNCLIVPFPGNNKKFYIFTVGTEQTAPPFTPKGLYYSIVNMNHDAGKGDIEPFYKNIDLPQSDLATYKITAVRHKNNRDVWVIVRNLSAPENEYHSYLITPSGLTTIPVRSSCITYANATGSGSGRGQMKVSPDGNLICSAVFGLLGNEIGSFDTNTGKIDILYSFVLNINNPETHGVEFSLDSKYLYLANYNFGNNNRLLQFDLSLLPNRDIFLASMKIISEPAGTARDLQAAPDGKIYVARRDSDYLGVINNPSAEGMACGYDSLGIYLGGYISGDGLPQFIQTYFLRFDYEGQCVGENYRFTPNFNPVPDSIHWDFGDPASGANNTSNELNPEHTYLLGGIYTVTAFVRYPDGREETATRDVTVSALPEPYPDSDTVICKGTTVTLQAEGGYDSYLWSTNQTTDFITVADTGYYWVEAVNAEGCIGRDTLHVGWHPIPQLTADTVISPTTCGNSIGAITGVNIIEGTPPYNVIWLNSTGDTIGTTNDLYNLGVDNYYLWVNDQSGCNVLLASCAINNFNSDLIIVDVNPTDTWCSQPLGELDVLVQSGLSNRLFYSIDNWATYQNNGRFTNLLSDSYYVKVKDSLGCEAVYAGNPVIIQNRQGLMVTGVTVKDETDLNADGEITVSASGDTLSYSINGSAPQLQGIFDGLAKGNYTITVTDAHGCDSTFTVVVDRITGQTLLATAGDTTVCNGLRASEPLLVSNFKDITSFEITLTYNNILLDATGYLNVHQDIASELEPMNYPATGTFSLRWTGTAPLTLPDNTVLMDIVMQGKNPGLSSVDWVLTSNETRFVNINGVSVPVIPVMGSVTVAPSPEIWGFYQEQVCENSTLSQMAIPLGGTGTSTIIWETPKGMSTGAEYKVDYARMADSGLYMVKVIDQMNCMATDSVHVTVIKLPDADFPAVDSIIYFEQSYQLEATPGYASYEWNTGDTTYFINVTEEGEYSVIIQTTEGCTDTSAVMMVSTWFPVNVPNAFTPNGDGLNDVFRPVVDAEQVRQFSMSIYNRWGQLFFETHDASIGWDGKDEPAGVYNWVITYSNVVGKVFKLKGSVALIK